MSSAVWTTPISLANRTADGANATDGQLSDSIWYYRTVVPVMILCCVVAFFTNLSILVSVHWLRRSLSPTLCFSISLAVADAYASLVVGVGLLIFSLLPVGYGINVPNNCVLLTVEGFRSAGLIVSVLHLLLLAVNHYIGIIRPLHYASTMTKRNAMVSIALMWLVSLAFVFIYIGSVPGEGFQSPNCAVLLFFIRRKFRITVSCLFFVPLALMFVMYAHIFVIVLQHNRGLQQFQGTGNFRQSVKAAVTTLVIIGTYTVGYMPAVLVYIIRCEDCAIPFTTDGNTVEVFFYVNAFTNTLMILKVLVNPIIYAARMKDIRLALKRMVMACMPFAGSLTGLTVDDTNSSFMRSRNDTIYTSIRMQSIRGRGDSPVLVYQKCNPVICRNGSSKSSHRRRDECNQNGLDKAPPSEKPAKTTSLDDTTNQSSTES